MRTRSRNRITKVTVAAALSLSMLSPTAVRAQDEASDWAEVPAVPGLAKLAGGGSLATGEAGSTVLVGFSGGKDGSALAWSSEDGGSWEQVTLPGAKRSTALAAAAGPDGFVAVGGGNAGGRAWHSPDGRTWTDVGKGLAPSGVIYDVSATPDGFVAVGFVNRGKGNKAQSIPTAWTSPDGLTWDASAIADVAGAGLSVTAGADGSLVSALYQPERRGPKKGRTFRILPPSLEFATSSDGATWQRAKDPFVENLGYMSAWDLTEAGGRFFFRADSAPGAVGSTPDGWYASDDGASWEPVPALIGINGPMAPYGDGAVAIDDGAVLVSADGAGWHSSYAEALAAVRPVISLAVLPDDRVLAAGASGGRVALYTGTPTGAGLAPSSECLDAAVETRLLDALGDFDLSELPGPEREGMAAAMAALQLDDEFASIVREELMRELRGGQGRFDFAQLVAGGDIGLPVCE